MSRRKQTTSPVLLVCPRHPTSSLESHFMLSAPHRTAVRVIFWDNTSVAKMPRCLDDDVLSTDVTCNTESPPIAPLATATFDGTERDPQKMECWDPASSRVLGTHEECSDAEGQWVTCVGRRASEEAN
ncbi:hypothetical protein PINS_up012467 [Pythium insidiosum]|nr:hypothetical protein PINS_up012467 [Pythium insidiosum]